MKMFQTNVIEKIETHISFSITFFRKSCRLCDYVDKFCRAGQATDDDGACALHAGKLRFQIHTQVV